MLVTTSLFAMVMYFTWGFSLWVSVTFSIVFGGLDLSFWVGTVLTFGVSLKVATIRKIPSGAWFPCVVGFSLTFFMLFWNWNGRQRLFQAISEFIGATRDLISVVLCRR